MWLVLFLENVLPLRGRSNPAEEIEVFCESNLAEAIFNFLLFY